MADNGDWQAVEIDRQWQMTDNGKWQTLGGTDNADDGQ